MAPKIIIDADLRDIIPAYLGNRNSELPRLAKFLAEGDFDALRKSGHQMAGSGGGYGFARITDLGQAIESAARAGNAEEIKKLLSELAVYLENIEPVYE